jgi:S-adenosylmethionine synthetase
MNNYIFTSESVTEGHPDKVCDYISDSILDAYLKQDPRSRVACETLCKDNHVVLAGEVTSSGKVDHDAVVRNAIKDIGYVNSSDSFHADGVEIQDFISGQSLQISQGVDNGTEQGAGDQGLMFGYATDETPELMPLPILLAHRLSGRLAKDRKSGANEWLRPDGKTQVSVLYENERPVKVTAIVVSTHHRQKISQKEIREYVETQLLPHALGDWHHKDIQPLVNPTGEFSIGGPTADCGVTGRKIIVDTYGGFARHGGGAFSGKDPSKVDRSAAYFARFVARQIVKSGLARRAEIQVSYAIGIANPVAIKVDTFGTGDNKAAVEYAEKFDFRPRAIVEKLNLLWPIYRQTTNYGHFGKPELSWEE